MSARARPADRVPVPVDTRHRFFQSARGESRMDVDALGWEAYLRETGVRYERRDLPSGRFQLYTHRIIRETWDGQSVWCCTAAPGGRRSPTRREAEGARAG